MSAVPALVATPSRSYSDVRATVMLQRLLWAAGCQAERQPAAASGSQRQPAAAACCGTRRRPLLLRPPAKHAGCCHFSCSPAVFVAEIARPEAVSADVGSGKGSSSWWASRPHPPQVDKLLCTVRQ